MLGKKLEVTDIKERMKLLIDGEVFYGNGDAKWYFDSTLHVDENPFRYSDCERWEPINKTWDSDWYYPAKTYTINGVELVDERMTSSEFKELGEGYLCEAMDIEGGDHVSMASTLLFEMESACEKSLMHHTKEAAIAHTKAMIKVQD